MSLVSFIRPIRIIGKINKVCINHKELEPVLHVCYLIETCLFSFYDFPRMCVQIPHLNLCGPDT